MYKSKLLKVCLLSFLAVWLSACQSTRHQESTDQYFSSTATTSAVKAKLLSTSGLNSRQITVTTYKGVVQLSGFVDSKWQANEAVRVARSVEGVRAVKNDLIVK